MTTKQYCEKVHEQDHLNKLLIPTMPIRENYSSLMSLKDAGFNLIYEPSIMKEYKYLVRQEIIGKIGRISRILAKQDKILIIRSVWRSFKHQRTIWDNRVVVLKKEYPDKSVSEINKITASFIAPEGKSMHATGGAVDALIFDQKTQKIMDFGTNDGLIINLNEQCYPYHPEISDIAKKNRKLLIHLFESEGFVVDIKEYWHFDYGNVIWAIEKKKKNAIYGIVKV